MTELEVLPPATQPWRMPIERRHEPAPATGADGYRKFRSCLRWEFGFSCAFCLLHETDFSEHDVEGWGLTGIEHRVPVSRDRSRRNDYSNCYYACRFCNIARGNRPIVDAWEHRLLDPCQDAWRDYFKLEADELSARGEYYADALHTLFSYDLNDERKVEMRRSRRETITECLDIVNRYDELQDRLLDLLRQKLDSTLLALSKELWGRFRDAYEDLERFSSVPEHADPACACGHDRHHSLPEVLQEQTIKVWTGASR